MTFTAKLEWGVYHSKISIFFKNLGLWKSLEIFSGFFWFFCGFPDSEIDFRDCQRFTKMFRDFICICLRISSGVLGILWDFFRCLHPSKWKVWHLGNDWQSKLTFVFFFRFQTRWSVIYFAWPSSPWHCAVHRH